MAFKGNSAIASRWLVSVNGRKGKGQCTLLTHPPDKRSLAQKEARYNGLLRSLEYLFFLLSTLF